MIDQKLTTERAQEAWVKKAIETGMTEAEALAVVQKMAAIEQVKSASKPKISSSLSSKRKLDSAKKGDFFVGVLLPSDLAPGLRIP